MRKNGPKSSRIPELFTPEAWLLFYKYIYVFTSKAAPEGAAFA